MSSVNPHYTFSYAQVPAYHFSHDSVFLARRAFDEVGDQVTAATRVLDLCAGCGIVGLDFLWHLRREREVAPARADFVEVQLENAAVFAENVRRFGATPTALEFLRLNYATFVPRATYDVILCNPPYFRVGEGKPPSSFFKARSRFFVDASWAALEACVRRALAPGGHAFVLTRTPERDAFTPEPGLVIARAPEDVRGTALWTLRRVADTPT